MSNEFMLWAGYAIVLVLCGHILASLDDRQICIGIGVGAALFTMIWSENMYKDMIPYETISPQAKWAVVLIAGILFAGAGLMIGHLLNRRKT